MNIGEIFSYVIGIIIVVYVAYVVISQLSQTTPGFAQYGWAMFAALMVGVIAFLKFGLFKK